MSSVFRSLDEARGKFGPCALAIGNFDGVHIGHQALLAAASEFAQRNSIAPSALTFHPHPTAIVAPERMPKLICTLEERIRLLSRFGAQHIFVLPFDATIARLSPEEFVTKILLAGIETRGVFVGENFRFGRNQQGDAAVLRSLGEAHGFAVRCVPPVSFRGEIVSSSAIRRYLAASNISRANRLLGRFFTLDGIVVTGHGVGSKQTVPTLNLRPDPTRVLPHGVFVTQTREPATGREWPSITNIGTRPTFAGDELTIETFLLSALDGESPEQIEVSFHRFVRAERRFNSPEDLKAQIMKDVARAQAYWRHAARLPKYAPSIY